jgi:RNA recognition motif-containing protein
MQSNLYVTNLAYTITDDALRAHFESCGHVNSAQVIVERDTGRARGFGFVEMGSDSKRKKPSRSSMSSPWVGA